MSQAAYRLPAVQPAVREPATFDAGGPVAALHGRIAAGLATPPAPEPWAFEGVSRAAGPVALACAYAGLAALLFG